MSLWTEFKPPADTDGAILTMAQLYNLALEKLKRIRDQREEILTAFVAKYGCEPEEVVQVVQKIDANTEVYYVTKRQPAELNKAGNELL